MVPGGQWPFLCSGCALIMLSERENGRRKRKWKLGQNRKRKWKDKPSPFIENILDGLASLMQLTLVRETL